MFKKCPDCGNEYEVNEENFYHTEYTGNGLTDICKGCCKKRSVAYHKLHPEKYKYSPKPTANRIRYYRRGFSWLGVFQFYGRNFALRSNGQLGHLERMNIYMKTQ